MTQLSANPNYSDEKVQKGPPMQPSLKWSWKIAEAAGIGIYMHWTFLILIAWIVYIHIQQGDNITEALKGVVFVLAIFACVVLHEFGHALTAKRYGIRTRDITLLPIGGVANLERMPEDPRQELAIAAAGPAVTLGIAAVLYVVIKFIPGVSTLNNIAVVGGPFLTKLMWVNVFILLFNLLPAFPMDGGRILRAILARHMEYARATQIAAGIGQGLAVLLGFLGFLYNWFLIFIALFVFLGAEAEAQMVTLRSTFRHVPVRDAMMTRFRALSANDTLDFAIDELLAGAQQDFPVTDTNKVIGLLQREHLFKRLANAGREGIVAEVMDTDCVLAESGEALDKTFERMRQAGQSTVPVLQQGQLVGILTLENIAEWTMVQSALRHLKTPVGIEHLARA